MIPEPSPASAAGTSAIAIVSSGMNELPSPRPIVNMARKIVGKKLVCAPAVASSTSPTIIRPMPLMSVRSAPKRRTTRAVTPSEITPTVSVHGMNARPVLSEP